MENARQATDVRLPRTSKAARKLEHDARDRAERRAERVAVADGGRRLRLRGGGRVRSLVGRRLLLRHSRIVQHEPRGEASRRPAGHAFGHVQVL